MRERRNKEIKKQRVEGRIKNGKKPEREIN
jgi:hypothetical protein